MGRTETETGAAGVFVVGGHGDDAGVVGGVQSLQPRSLNIRHRHHPFSGLHHIPYHPRLHLDKPIQIPRCHSSQLSLSLAPWWIFPFPIPAFFLGLVIPAPGIIITSAAPDRDSGQPGTLAEQYDVVEMNDPQVFFAECLGGEGVGETPEGGFGFFNLDWDWGERGRSRSSW